MSAVLLAGCSASGTPTATGSGAGNDGTSGSGDASAPAAPTDDASADTDAPIASGEPAPTADCGLAPDDPRIVEAISEVPAPFTDPAKSDIVWSDQVVDTNFDPCEELSYAVITIEGATGSSPMQVMLFGRGEYLGTTSDCAPGYQTVEQNDADSIVVTYEWPQGGAGSTGEMDSEQVQYSLVDGQISMSNPLPEEIVSEASCHTWPPKA